jgi:hypothetical protein
MSQGLAFNGMTDYIGVPTMTINKIVLDCYVDSQMGNDGVKYLVSNGIRSQGAGTYFLMSYSNQTGWAVNNRTTVTITNPTAIASAFNLFTRADAVTSFLQGKLYSVKFYNNSTLVAYYDVTTPNGINWSTGKVIDLTGNGYNGDLHGGLPLIKPTMQGMQFNGATDIVTFPASMGATTFILDVEIATQGDSFYRSIFDVRSAFASAFSGGYYSVREIGAGYTTYKINGVDASRTVNDTSLPKNKRITIELGVPTPTSGSGTIKMFGFVALTDAVRGRAYSLTCKNGSGAIVAYYNFSTGTAKDLSGNGNHGTLTGTQVNLKPIQQGMQFNGAIDKISITNNNSLSPEASANGGFMTIELWLNLRQPPSGTAPYIFSKGNITGNWEYGISVSSTGSIVFSIFNTSGVPYTLDPSNMIISFGRINHIIFTFSVGQFYKGYLNGTSTVSSTNLRTGYEPVAGSSNVNIGIRGDTSGGYIAGTIYSARLFNTALTQTQVTQQYQAGIQGSIRSNLVGEWCIDTTGKDTSGNGNHGTLTGTQANIKPTAQGLAFNGFTDYLMSPSVTVTEIVIDFVKYSKIDGSVGHVFDTRNTNTPYLYLSSSGTSDFYAGSISALYVNGTIKTAGGAVAPTGRRVLVRAVFTSAITGVINFFTRNDHFLGQLMRGNAYSIKMYNGSTLVAYYDFSTGTAKDFSGNNNHATIVGNPKLLIKPAQQGLRFNGASINADYFKLPSVLMNKIEIDCFIDSMSSINQYLLGNSAYVARFQPSSTTLFTNATTVTGAVIGSRTTLTINMSSSFTFSSAGSNAGYIFSDTAGSNGAKGIIYSIKCYNAGTLVASYDLTSNTPTKDVTGNGNDGTLNGSPQKIIKSM